ncbi:oxidoreductase [Arthrobacter sp. JZ12]|uniref:Gfo/Idh/MocA family protein n=1 Tax=Arthrobacter sp. JZ12 TaxID=2654190 RepID=UPI002B46EDDF|nr:Gfo/Idh/MocA family oxidoreductase [Arthrobacter sp. JZ12]WRH26201.1 oxidoreductase [Arthrobacter sp. JZ12]
MGEIRTALIGFGLGGRVFHAPFVNSNPRYVLNGVVTSNDDRIAQVEERYPNARIFRTVDDLWGKIGDFDLVIVSTPPSSHTQLAEQALRLGVAVVVDKPFVVSAADGERLINLAREEDKLLTVFQNRRWDGDFLTVRKLLEEGRLGTVRRFESRMETYKPLVTKPWKASAGPAEGGGILFDLGPHLIDQALQLFGDAELVHAERAAHREQEGPDDDVFLALRHASGVISHLWMNTLAPQAAPRFRVTGSASAYTKWGTDVQEAAVDAGMLPTDPGYGVEDRLAWGLLGFDHEATKLPTEKGNYPAFYDLLASALQDGGPVPVDPVDSLRAHRIIEKAHSLQAG